MGISTIPVCLMEFSKFGFRTSLSVTLIMLLGVAVLTSLGVWQLNRAEFKQQLEDEIKQLMLEPALEVKGHLEVESIKRFRQLVVKGEYRSEFEVLLDNATWQGQAGYHVITPLRIGDTETYVLVNRGWLPVGNDRKIIPVTESPLAEVEVRGRLGRLRGKPAFISGDIAPDDGGGKVWFYIDADYFSEKTGLDIEPYLILLDKENVGGYARDWPSYEGRYGMHMAYAVQWFAFALFVLFIYLWVGFKKDE